MNNIALQKGTWFVDAGFYERLSKYMRVTVEQLLVIKITRPEQFVQVEAGQNIRNRLAAAQPG